MISGSACTPTWLSARLRFLRKGLGHWGRQAWAFLRSRWRRPEFRAAPFAVFWAATIILLNNGKLFSLVSDRVDLLSFSGLGCLFTIFLALTGMITLALLLLGYPYVLKPLVIVGLLLSAVLSHFTRELSVVFDVEMIRNVAESIRDLNTQEATELLSVPLAIHVFFFGVLPSAVVLVPRIAYGAIRREILLRALYGAGLAILTAGVFLANFRRLSYLSRENFDARCYATPTYALNSLRKYATSSWRSRRAEFVEVGTDAVQRKSGRGRTVGVLVVGETARADHFSLNGYPRKTNPLLERRELVNYPSARAAGTSTAYSVPYMFSFLGKSRFTTDRAANQSNLLDVLARAGIKILWIENNSGSKRVSDRVGYIDLRNTTTPESGPYADGGYFDEVLVGEMERHLRSTEGDILIVLHTMGSHGPAYYRRYPPAFEVFTPTCRQNTPQRSSQEEVINAYDNTILYTDYVLNRLIASLEGSPDTDNAFLFYVSDHGESLGENGVYLHGLPEVIAPPAQTHIPMLAWLSPRIIDDRSLDVPRIRQRARAPSSHDNVASTMLGLYEVTTSLYSEELDLLQSR